MFLCSVWVVLAPWCSVYNIPSYTLPGNSLAEMTEQTYCLLTLYISPPWNVCLECCCWSMASYLDQHEMTLCLNLNTFRLLCLKFVIIIFHALKASSTWPNFLHWAPLAFIYLKSYLNHLIFETATFGMNNASSIGVWAAGLWTITQTHPHAQTT